MFLLKMQGPLNCHLALQHNFISVRNKNDYISFCMYVLRMNSLSQAVAEVLHRKSCFLNQPGTTEMFCLVYPETTANCWDTHTPTPTAGNIHLLYGILVIWMDGWKRSHFTVLLVNFHFHHTGFSDQPGPDH